MLNFIISKTTNYPQIINSLLCFVSNIAVFPDEDCTISSTVPHRNTPFVVKGRAMGRSYCPSLSLIEKSAGSCLPVRSEPELFFMIMLKYTNNSHSKSSPYGNNRRKHHIIKLFTTIILHIYQAKSRHLNYMINIPEYSYL